ncbi:MAG: CxxC-x17-CxxC domain-containing protein [bacterium]
MFNKGRGKGFGGGFKGGGKRFGGGGRPWDRGGQGGARTSMHSAVCTQCGAACEVPFRPNGKKPIFCSNCFKRDAFPKQKSFGGDSPAPAFKDQGSDRISEQLRAINEKLDTLLDVLTGESEE